MDICRHYYPNDLLKGCAIGRVAQLDCGSRCPQYNPEPEPLIRKIEDRELWDFVWPDDEQPA